MRICKHCKRELPVEMFRRYSRAKDGIIRICLPCWPVVFRYGCRNYLDGIAFPQHTYLTDADPPRTLRESFEDTRRRHFERESWQRGRVEDGARGKKLSSTRLTT